MTEHTRATDDELALRIARALRSREHDQPDPTLVAARIEAQLAGRLTQPSPARTMARRGTRIVAAGVVTSALAVAGAGAAAAANPYTEFARIVEELAQAAGSDWSAMPEGYTREQYEAFWGAEHTTDDVLRLSALWHSDATATKARAGQMILDGKSLPTALGEDPAAPTDPTAPADPAPPTPVPAAPPTDLEYKQEHFQALEIAGYSIYDEMLLSEMWALELDEAKARAGQMLLDGLTLPILPGAGDYLAEPGALAAEAYWDAGYTDVEAMELAELWDVDLYEAKARAGQMILDGQVPPVLPVEGDAPIG